MWHIELTHSWVNTVPQFLAKEVEIATLLVNIRRFKALLQAGMSPKEPDQDYLRKLPSAIIAVTQSGIAAEPAELQAYTFPNEIGHVLWLLGIGKAAAEHADMEYYKPLVYTLTNVGG